MQQMEVNPPAAAARAPDSMVSAYSKPGSRRWTCISMKPGATINPVASNFSAPVTCSFSPMTAMRPSSTNTSRIASRRLAGSITRPFRIINFRIKLIVQDSFQHGHAHRDSVLHLVENHGALGIGHLGRNFPSAIDGTRVHHDGVRFSAPHMLQAKAVKPIIVAGRKGRLVLPLELNAQHHDYVGVADGLTDIMRESDAGRDLSKFGWQQRRGSAQHDLGAKFRKQIH